MGWMASGLRHLLALTYTMNIGRASQYLRQSSLTVKHGKTYAYIDDHLNELGVTTVNGSRWFPITVQRCAVRLSCGNTLG